MNFSASLSESETDAMALHLNHKLAWHALDQTLHPTDGNEETIMILPAHKEKLRHFIVGFRQVLEEFTASDKRPVPSWRKQPVLTWKEAVSIHDANKNCALRASDEQLRWGFNGEQLPSIQRLMDPDHLDSEELEILLFEDRWTDLKCTEANALLALEEHSLGGGGQGIGPRASAKRVFMTYIFLNLYLLKPKKYGHYLVPDRECGNWTYAIGAALGEYDGRLCQPINQRMQELYSSEGILRPLDAEQGQRIRELCASLFRWLVNFQRLANLLSRNTVVGRTLNPEELFNELRYYFRADFHQLLSTDNSS